MSQRYGTDLASTNIGIIGHMCHPSTQAQFLIVEKVCQQPSCVGSQAEIIFPRHSQLKKLTNELDINLTFEWLRSRAKFSDW